MRSRRILIEIGIFSVVADGSGIENHTRNGDAMPFSRCEWAIAERDSRTPATRDKRSRVHQCYKMVQAKKSRTACMVSKPYSTFSIIVGQ